MAFVDLESIRKRIRDGWSGRDLAFFHASYIDALINGTLSEITEAPPFAVFGTGSYGRQELCPFSDIDILVVAHKGSQTETVKAFFYKLWDKGYNISHAFRTPSECVAEGMRDIQTRTAIIESRFICGEPAMKGVFSEEVLQKLRARKRKDYVSSMLRSVQERHAKQGGSPFLLQPDIKESKGGLRDIQSALWLTEVLYKYRDLNDLKGILIQDELKKLIRAYDFMLRLRFIVHVLSKRKNDKFLFEFHQEAASMLNIRRSKKFSAVERMMRYYFLQSRNISVCTGDIYRKCGEAVTKKFFHFGITKINDDFYLSRKKLIARDDEVIKRSPVKIFEAFWLSATKGYQMSGRLLRTIKRSALRIRPRHRSSQRITELFLGIISSANVYNTLRNMHETGILDRFIPEFGALRHLMIMDYYHTYPVDEHTMICIRTIEELEHVKSSGVDGLKSIFRNMEKKNILYLAVLLHDSGKAKGKVHETEGYRNILNVAERFSLDSESRNLVEFLVRNHMLMAETAFKHDVESPEVIASFADRVKREDFLDALYLMTYADMSSVSDSFWTRWRASLLDRLYAGAKAHIRGFRIEKTNILADIRKRFESKMADFLQAMPEDYFLSVPANRVLHEGELFEKALNEGFAMSVEDQHDGTVTVIVSAKDRKGMFADVVSVFSVRRLNIIEAKLFTSDNGWAFDKLRISNWHELWWDGMEKMIETDLMNVLLQNKRIKIDEHRSGRRGVEPLLDIDNEKNDEFTVIEIMAPDRLGLLYDVSQSLGECSVNIINGRINTEQGIANDIFYVNSFGSKLDSVTICSVIDLLWKTIKN